MKLIIERAALLKSLGHVQSVVERRNTIPILSNVRIDAAKGGLALNATDMDIEIVESAAADVGKTGATTVPAHTLYDIVRKLPDGAQVEIDQAHYVVKPLGGLFSGYLQHFVHNESADTVADVTALCRLAP